MMLHNKNRREPVIAYILLPELVFATLSRFSSRLSSVKGISSLILSSCAGRFQCCS